GVGLLAVALLAVPGVGLLAVAGVGLLAVALLRVVLLPLRVLVVGVRVLLLVGLLLAGVRLLLSGVRLFRLGLVPLGLLLGLPVGGGAEDAQLCGFAVAVLGVGDLLQPPPGLLDAFEDAGQPRTDAAGGLVIGVDAQLDHEHAPFLLRRHLGVLDDGAVPHDLCDAHL